MDNVELVKAMLEKVVLRNEKDIAAYLNSFDNEIEIFINDFATKDIDINDRSLANNTIPDEEFLSFTNRGIQIADMSCEIYQMLRNYIPKSIEKLTIPLYSLQINTILEDFPNLREVIASDYLKQSESCYSLENKKEKVIKLDIPEERKIADKFQENFVVAYFPIGTLRVNIYSRKETNKEKIKPIFSGKIIDDKVINDIKFKTSNIKEIVLILDWLDTADYKTDSITLDLENKTYEDIDLLRNYISKFDIKFDYGGEIKATYDEFVTMRASIDWYKELIDSSNLSPFEKLIFAYDILKTFSYRDNESEPYNPRIIPNILISGDIVCSGYSRLLFEILSEEGITTFTYSISFVEKEVKHRRNIIKLDDDKYDIHGLYTLDATWDRVRNDLSLVKDSDGYCMYRYDGEMKESDIVIEKYDALSLYQNFLVPYSDYREVYPDEDSIPEVFKVAEEEKYTFVDLYYPYLEMKMIFGTGDREMAKEYILNSKKPSLEKFAEALTVVRKAEGYGSLVDENVRKTIELNIDLNQSNYSQKNFFVDDEKCKKLKI